MVRETGTCRLGKGVKQSQVMGRGNRRHVTHRGCQGGQLGLDIDSVSVPTEKGMDGVSMPKVMDAGNATVLHPDAGPAEQQVQGAAKARP